MKVYDYIIVCKRPNYKLIDGISQLMLFLAIVIFAATLSYANERSAKTSIFLVIIILLILGWWIYSYLLKKKGNISYYRIALLFAAIGIYSQPNGFAIALIYLFAAIMEKQVKFPYEIAFDEEGIVINSFPKKKVAWPEITNVVLKDGIITLDFQNNTLIQKEIQTSVTHNTENEFNTFCKNKLTT